MSYLGIDIGTSGCKAVAFDEKGKMFTCLWSLSDLGFLLVVARVRAFLTERQKAKERANMRYYKQIHPQLRSFLSPTGSYGSTFGDQGLCYYGETNSP